MFANKDGDEKINISGLTETEVGLIQSAILILAEQTDNKEHARLLRRIAMLIDRQLNN